ncbi:TatD family nuclease-associated radical SAM protein [Desulfolucanica intricata]|uniref:TatD family nuclease-associated radical SAM protein n=1 Tax=Desulfolucanica intricata TaxID=1285191 RepID=UPI00082C709C|nr:TatD family nuclease-associated radical SAM protein [Desulfolucanica intricata]
MVKQVITYKINDSLYINVTNRCSNSCVFCIRQTEEGVGYNLWLKKEPDIEDIIKEIPNPKDFKEIVFCGYGEPLIRAKLVLEVSSILKQKGAHSIRINTNGHANMIHNQNIIPEMKDIIDIVSISLNAENVPKYVKLCRPVFGEKAYPALLEFARLSSKTVNKVILTAVDWPGIDLKACKQIADNIGVEFRSRNFTGTIKSNHKKII